MIPASPNEQDQDPQEIADDFDDLLEQLVVDKHSAVAGVSAKLTEVLDLAESLDLPKSVIMLLVSLVYSTRRDRSEFLRRLGQAHARLAAKKQKDELAGAERLAKVLAGEDPFAPKPD